MDQKLNMSYIVHNMSYIVHSIVSLLCSVLLLPIKSELKALMEVPYVPKNSKEISWHEGTWVCERIKKSNYELKWDMWDEMRQIRWICRGLLLCETTLNICFN